MHFKELFVKHFFHNLARDLEICASYHHCVRCICDTNQNRPQCYICVAAEIHSCIVIEHATHSRSKTSDTHNTTQGHTHAKTQTTHGYTRARHTTQGHTPWTTRSNTNTRARHTQHAQTIETSNNEPCCSPITRGSHIKSPPTAMDSLSEEGSLDRVDLLIRLSAYSSGAKMSGYWLPS